MTRNHNDPAPHAGPQSDIPLGAGAAPRSPVMTAGSAAAALPPLHDAIRAIFAPPAVPLLPAPKRSPMCRCGGYLSIDRSTVTVTDDGIDAEAECDECGAAFNLSAPFEVDYFSGDDVSVTRVG